VDTEVADDTTIRSWHKLLLQAVKIYANLGLIVFLLGLAFGLYLSLVVYRAEAVGAFSRPIIDFVPFEWLDQLDCPALLTRNETGTIIVTLENPSDEAIEYSVHIAAHQIGQSERSDGLVSISGPERAQAARFFGSDTLRTSGTLPARGAADVTWKVRVTDRQNNAISVNVYADVGNHLFSGSCGVALMNIPGFSGRQIVSLILLSMPVGLLLWLYGRMPLSRLGRVGIITGILLWVVIKWFLT
jgi:hypothetical protein